MQTLIGVLVVGLGVLAALPAAAQGVVPQAPQPGVQIQSTAPTPAERPARVVSPPLQYETSRPPDNDWYPGGPSKVEHNPAFVEPLAAHYETTNGSGMYGFSGWTAPNPPVGSQQTGWKDVSGWFVMGFTVTWDGPPAPKSPARPR
jgi:hypothetical protein